MVFVVVFVLWSICGRVKKESKKMKKRWKRLDI